MADTQQTLTFIGLGNMGGPMAANLAKAGFDVIVHDLNADAVATALQAGCRTVEGLGQGVAASSAVVTMLPAGQHVQSVYLGADGILAAAKPGTLFIDSSTIDVESVRRVSAAATDTGHSLLDAPVSGGVGGAVAGTLTFMVGGPEAAFDRAQPILKAMGKNIFHAGDSGTGQVAKMANNMLLASTMIATCEAFNLAENNGLSAQTFFDIASTATGQSWSMTSYCPAPGPVAAAPSNRDYQPGFAAALMLKDLRLALEAARASKTATPLGSASESLYALMEASGHDGLDFSGVMKLLKGNLS